VLGYISHCHAFRLLVRASRKRALADGSIELVRKSRVSFWSSTTTAGSNRADGTDLSVTARAQGATRGRLERAEVEQLNTNEALALESTLNQGQKAYIADETALSRMTDAG
jgi:hypothetical protein